MNPVTTWSDQRIIIGERYISREVIERRPGSICQDSICLGVVSPRPAESETEYCPSRIGHSSSERKGPAEPTSQLSHQ